MKRWSLGRFLFELAWSKDRTWQVTSASGERHVFLFHIGTVAVDEMTAWTLFMGPMSLTVCNVLQKLTVG